MARSLKNEAQSSLFTMAIRLIYELRNHLFDVILYADRNDGAYETYVNAEIALWPCDAS